MVQNDVFIPPLLLILFFLGLVSNLHIIQKLQLETCLSTYTFMEFLTVSKCFLKTQYYLPNHKIVFLYFHEIIFKMELFVVYQIHKLIIS